MAIPDSPAAATPAPIQKSGPAPFKADKRRPAESAEKAPAPTGGNHAMSMLTVPVPTRVADPVQPAPQPQPSWPNQPADGNTFQTPVAIPAQPGSWVTPLSLTSDVAFAARVVEKDAKATPEEDSFVRATSPKPATPHIGAAAYGGSAAYTEIAPKTAKPSGPDPQPQPVAAFSQERKPQAREARPEAAIESRAVETTDFSLSTMSGGDPTPVSDPSPAPAAPRQAGADDHSSRTADVRGPEESRVARPVRDVTVRLSADNQQVDVKLVDRGGHLHVAVHSADPVLSADLRASVHDLVGGLEKSGFRTETWQPGDTPRHVAGPASTDASGACDQPHSQNGGDDPRRQGRNGYEMDQSWSRRNRGSETDWIEQWSAFAGAEREN
jgi:hypothetical protein